jgi:hypothetical protein
MKEDWICGTWNSYQNYNRRILRWSLRHILGRHELYSFAPGWVRRAGSHEHGNEQTGSIEGRKFPTSWAPIPFSRKPWPKDLAGSLCVGYVPVVPIVTTLHWVRRSCPCTTLTFHHSLHEIILINFAEFSEVIIVCYSSIFCMTIVFWFVTSYTLFEVILGASDIKIAQEFVMQTTQ